MFLLVGVVVRSYYHYVCLAASLLMKGIIDVMPGQFGFFLFFMDACIHSFDLGSTT